MYNPTLRDYSPVLENKEYQWMLHHHSSFQYASGIRRGRTQEESGPGWGHSVPSTGRQLRSFSQKIVSIHQGSEGRSLSHLAIVLIFLPGEIFLLLAFGALCERWALCCSSTLPPYWGPGRGRPETWGTSPSVLSWSSTRCSRPISCLGAGQDGKWRTGGRRLGPAGKSESSLEWGLWGCAGADRNGHIPDKNIIPHVRERSVKVRPPHCTPGGKLCLRSDAGYWREEERWSLLQWTLGEFEKLSNLNETKSFVKHPWVWGKNWII